MWQSFPSEAVKEAVKEAAKQVERVVELQMKEHPHMDRRSAIGDAWILIQASMKK